MGLVDHSDTGHGLKTVYESKGKSYNGGPRLRMRPKFRDGSNKCLCFPVEKPTKYCFIACRLCFRCFGIFESGVDRTALCPARFCAHHAPWPLEVFPGVLYRYSIARWQPVSCTNQHSPLFVSWSNKRSSVHEMRVMRTKIRKSVVYVRSYSGRLLHPREGRVVDSDQIPNPSSTMPRTARNLRRRPRPIYAD